MTVSIIMPVYNGSRFIDQAVRSVISQTYLDWELLIIDDCSSDNSAGIAEQFVQQDSRIKLLHTNSPSGCPSIPRNIGIQNARGRFIAFLDCDDVWLPTKLQRQLPLFEDDSTAIVFSYYEKMDESGYRAGRLIVSPARVSYPMLLKGNCIGNLTAVYDTGKVGKIVQKDIRHEDYVMWLDILRRGYVACNTETCEAVYREQKGSVSGNKFSLFSWQWNIYRKELHIPFFKSCYYFACYALNGFKKYMK